MMTNCLSSSTTTQTNKLNHLLITRWTLIKKTTNRSYKSLPSRQKNWNKNKL